jgi:putative endonuclease
VARVYRTRGATLLERRWRGAGGEVDLIVLEKGEYVFCEVKAARDAGAAMQRLRPAQVHRIHAAASEYLSTTPEGQLTTLRFDLATVDETGRVDIVENAFGHF